ncbi:large ribosomal subunit protein bL17m isoform X1 [Pituophis catenifer annectens]|uniref:large ribosomal subunit protein bL17m isoform X1 n=1 Tax=Pituophis catenifer annectens TaxID=94852 RepID=UPI0039935BB4
MRLTAALGISHGRLRRRIGFGPRSRLDLLRNLVTGLVRHERIETTRARADEMRFYAEHVSGGEGRKETGGGASWRPWTPLPLPLPHPPPPSGVVSVPQLIEHAKRGDTDPQAMRLADFWLTEKDLVHKLFKVLAPRFAPHQGDYTRMVRIPKNDSLDRAERAVIEYKGNPLPPLPLPRRDGEKTLVNQLLKGYREERGTTV